jgi:hypothetical protein
LLAVIFPGKLLQAVDQYTAVPVSPFAHRISPVHERTVYLFSIKNFQRAFRDMLFSFACVKQAWFSGFFTARDGCKPVQNHSYPIFIC